MFVVKINYFLYSFRWKAEKCFGDCPCCHTCRHRKLSSFIWWGICLWQRSITSKGIEKQVRCQYVFSTLIFLSLPPSGSMALFEQIFTKISPNGLVLINHSSKTNCSFVLLLIVNSFCSNTSYICLCPDSLVVKYFLLFS